MPDFIATGFAHNGPLVLLVTGAVVLIYGIVSDSLTAMGIAAFVIVLAVVLPRLYGAFKRSGRVMAP